MSKLHLLDRQRPYIMAHRGNRVQFPENTLSAFQQTVSDGADIIETDLQTSSDGASHCIRDATLDRSTNGTGTVSELQYEEVRSYNAAATRPDLPSEPVPTIRELAKVTSFPIMIALELKSDAFLEPETCQHLSKEIRREELHERIAIFSFSSPRLHTMRSVDPDLPIGWITSNCSWPQPGMEMLSQY